MGSDCQGGASAAPAELLNSDSGTNGVHAGAAIFFGNVKAKQPQRTHLFSGVPVELAGLVHLFGLRLDFFGDKIVDGIAPEELLFR